MFSYVVGLLACLLVLYNPLSQLLLGRSPSAAPQIRRTPRPAINESLLALDDWAGNLTCGNDRYSVHLFSKEPLIMYVEGFISKEERAHLLEIRCVPIFNIHPSLLLAVHADREVPSPWVCDRKMVRLAGLSRRGELNVRMARFGHPVYSLGQVTFCQIHGARPSG